MSKLNKLVLVVAALLLGGVTMGKPLKIYVLVGQSNMEGHAAVRTFEHIGMDPQTAPILKDIMGADGKPVVCNDAYISYLTGGRDGPLVKEGKLTTGFGAQGREPKVGPEFTFGIYMHKHLNDPILLIKTAWGGKSLCVDFRPPSAKAVEGKGQGTVGPYYAMMLDHVKKVLADPGKVCPAYKKDDGYEVAGFVWFQGWNDMVNGEAYPNRYKPGGYAMYSKLLAHFIRDVRKDFDAPNMKFVIGVMGAGGPTRLYTSKRYQGVHQYFRDAMAAPASMPEFKGNVAAVLTEKYWDPQLAELDERMGKINGMLKNAQKAGQAKSRQDRETLKQKLINEHFTAKELKILQIGKSNAGFHYLGSGKVMCQIGKAFADAMAEMPSK